MVRAGAAVAAIRSPAGQTIATGFLVRGSDLSSRLPDEKSYILTNSHVVWDPTLGAFKDARTSHHESLLPADARIVFEQMEISGEYRCARVIWQSPPEVCDAILIELDRNIETIQPLVLGSSSTPLIAAGGNNPGSALAIIGHAGGRALSLSSLSAPIQTSASKLIDFGPKGTTSEPVYLHYTTPTEAGNSGSPVIELENWTVVAVHHMGFPPDGLPRLGGKSGVNIANEGVSIHSIRKAIDASLSSTPTSNVSQKKKGLFGW